MEPNTTIDISSSTENGENELPPKYSNVPTPLPVELHTTADTGVS